MSLAPVVLFVYNRPWHTKQTIEALQKNELASKSELFVFSDDFKNENDKFSVNKVRRLVRNIKRFKKIAIIEREKNLGLARSIITGVTQIVNKYGKIIVLEDDLIISPHFLQFMNDGLNFYEKEDKVASINSYFYPTKRKLPETFFLNWPDCWGWGTWKRAWSLFEPNSHKLLYMIKSQKLESELNIGDSYDYLGMLKNQIAGKNDSWAIRWHASIFLKDKLNLYPGKSLTVNIGHDRTGTHADFDWRFKMQKFNMRPVKITKIPLKRSEEAVMAFRNFFTRSSTYNSHQLFDKIKNNLLLSYVELKKNFSLF